MNQHHALLTEIQNLRTDLAALSVRVLALESQGPLTAGARESFVTPPQSPLVINYAGGSSPVPVVPPFPQPESVVTTPSATTSLPSPAPTSRASQTADLAAARISAAEEAGAFIQRSLAGDHRGTSGREKVPFASRYYLLFRDYQGNCFNPIQLHRSWASIKPLVKPNNHCGDSIFIGWPTLQEAKICVESAGLNWPTDA